MSISGITDFDAAIELRAGACEDFENSAVVGCDHNLGIANRLELSNVNLSAGTYCLVVDGRYDSSTNERHSGAFNLSLRLQTSVPGVCGNGLVELGEACDDGNTLSGDGCRSDCTIEGCGDGILDSGEQCDDGNTQAGDGCRADCTQEVCGDGIVDNLAGEACDDGNTQSGDGCQSDCLSIQSGWGCFGNPSTCVPGFEQEPNDDINQASSTSVSGASLATVSGTIDPATDIDFWSFTVPALSSMNLSAHIYGTLGNTNSCNGDSVMQVWDASSSVVAENDDSNGLCSSVSNVAITNSDSNDAEYYIRVQSYRGESTFLYLLDVTLQ